MDEEEFVVTAEEYVDLTLGKGFPEHFRQEVAEKFREGFREGQETILLHTAQCRLRRPLTDDERANVRSQMHAMGAKRVLEVVHYLDPRDLAAWLAQPPT